MITLLIGDNSFEIERALGEITHSFDGAVEKIDGSQLQLNQLPDILMGVSLFATARTVVIRGLSENKSIWSVFGDWLPRISDDIHLVLIEPKIDKRTNTYKSLSKSAKVQEFKVWNSYDYQNAEKWVIDESKKIGLKLDKKNAQTLVQRVGIDQWQLFHALEKLSLIGVLTDEIIKNVIDPNPVENVFELLETAINGDNKKLKIMINIFKQSEDVYKLSGLIYSQVFQLSVVVSASKSDNIAKDFGINPYVITKLQSIAKRLGKRGVSKIVSIFAQCDDDMKISRAEPWLLLEKSLYKVAAI